MFLNKAGEKQFRFTKVDDLLGWRVKGEAVEGNLPTAVVTPDNWNFVVGRGADLFTRLSQMDIKLGDVVTGMFVGQQTSADPVYLFKEFRTGTPGFVEVFSKQIQEWVTLESKVLRPVIRSGSIGRYWATPTAMTLFPYEVKTLTARLLSVEDFEKYYPLAWGYLAQNRDILRHREKGKFEDSEWYRFGRSQNLGMWEQPKLMVPYMITRLAAYPDYTDNYYFINVTTGGYGLTIDDSQGNLLFLSGLLNSRLLDFYLKKVSTNFQGGYFAANKQYIEQLPIRTIDWSSPRDEELHNRIVALVVKMMELHQRLSAARSPTDRNFLQRQIRATDHQIDRLVYDLYGLTDEGIEIVEEG
jgi:hypothetical protein